MKYKSMLKDIPLVEFDDDSVTAMELSEIMGVEESTARRLARRKVANGTWERVYKRVGGKRYFGYRPKGTVGKQ